MKGSNPKAAEHYSKCKSRWNEIRNLGRCSGGGMGSKGHQERREETRSPSVVWESSWGCGNPRKSQVKTIFTAFKNKNLSFSQECTDKEFRRGYMM